MCQMERHEMLLHTVAAIKNACGNDKVALERPKRARHHIIVVKNVAKLNVMIGAEWNVMRCCCMQWLWSRMHVEMTK